MTMPPDFTEYRCEELLGALNPVEEKFAPKQIFAAGHIEILERGFRVSIVGSRKASQDGMRRAAKLSKLVCENGGVVVSGLAEGIDTAAHRAAIDAGGSTLAVIGTPLDRVYPKSSEHLQTEIMQNHLCISQFPPGYPTTPKNFPIRNRTMALFSDATVIIEAGEKSGTIHQGWEALRLGRGLFIAKSLAEHPKLTWIQTFLEYGGQVLSSEDMDEFFESLPFRDSSISIDAGVF